MEVLAEVTGKVWKVLVAEGETVEEGQTLIIVESMKMEIPVDAPAAGRARVLVGEGDAVEDGMKVAEIDE